MAGTSQQERARDETISSVVAPRAYRRLGFRPDLEGMRAVAVLLVLVYHAGVPFLPGGYVGVDVFFVLSGFLITNHLLHEISSTGRLRVGAFYARRARRLLPASLAVILATVAIVAVWAPPRLADAILVDARAAIGFVPNFLFAIRNTDYLAEDATSPLLHYWSLGVEEQFYLAWPLLLLVLWRVLRGRSGLVIAAVLALTVVSLAVSVILTSISEPWAYFSPWSRAWELGAGALVAAARLHERAWHAAVAGAATWAGVAMILLAALIFDETTAFPGSAALLPVLGTVLVIAAAPSSTSWGAGVVLDRAPMRFLGRISYVLYLVHWPVLILPIVLSPTGSPLPLAQSLLLAGAAIPVAWILHRTIEQPILRSPRVSAAGARRILVAAAIGVLAVLALTQAAAAAIAAKPLATDRVVETPVLPEGDPTPETLPVPGFTDVVPVNLEPALADAASDLPRIYADGCHLGLDRSEPASCVYGDVDAGRTIVLFGDSHAAQWFPALEQFATREGYRLVSHTKSSCPPFAVEILNNGVVDTGCAQWRDAVVSELEAAPPELVVLSGFAHYDEYGSPEVTEQAWAAGIEAVVPRLSRGSEVLVVDDTPRFPRTPALCLSANITSAAACAADRDSALDASWIASQRAAVEAAGGSSLSVAPWLCDESRCGAIIGNLLVYRDQHHIATRIATLLEPVLASALLPDTL
ncbi:acyltransferase family protein [Microcella alkalica]|uniref:acyltransferase family protein n=1 Tax=Microcella alkalica TaxID=355930 RepID=UPI00145E2427|nr:acyltransferase family protein [Microcella alkalica]